MTKTGRPSDAFTSKAIRYVIPRHVGIISNVVIYTLEFLVWTAASALKGQYLPPGSASTVVDAGSKGVVNVVVDVPRSRIKVLESSAVSASPADCTSGLNKRKRGWRSGKKKQTKRRWRGQRSCAGLLFVYTRREKTTTQTTLVFADRIPTRITLFSIATEI